MTPDPLPLDEDQAPCIDLEEVIATVWRMYAILNDLTDSQLIALYEKTTTGVRDGTLATFGDAESLREDIRRRFGK